MKKRRALFGGRLLIFLFLVALAWGCAGFGLPGRPPAVPEVHPGYLRGYIAFDKAPDSLVLLGPPPAAGSAAAALDEEVFQARQALRNTPRWSLAVDDANLKFPAAADAFSCALDLPISERETPYLYQILRRSMTDAIVATLKAKNRYQRIRPFVAHATTTCSPDWEEELRKDGSYPSGHSAIGWTWALILSELDPAHGDALVVRGRAFGESRVICNCHWQSDVLEGRFIGSAVFSRLHASPGFVSDMKAARAEMTAARARSLKPDRNCVAEKAALLIAPPAER